MRETVTDAAGRHVDALNRLRLDPCRIALQGHRRRTHVSVRREQFTRPLAPGGGQVEDVGGPTLAGGAAHLREPALLQVYELFVDDRERKLEAVPKSLTGHCTPVVHHLQDKVLDQGRCEPRVGESQRHGGGSLLERVVQILCRQAHTHGGVQAVS